MSKTIDEKRELLVERTSRALKVSKPEAESLLSISRQQSLRLNILRPLEKAEETLPALGWSGHKYEWYADGLTIDTGLQAVRDSNLVREGQIYIQNAASWLPVLALDPKPDEQILDVCAAPGGKTSHIADLSGNKAFITANDNSRARLMKLKANLTRLGVQNVEYTLYDAGFLARKLESRQFDKILLDAPCSGEGMMSLGNDKDFESWSVAHIKRLQQLQKKILVQAWKLLKPGGTLVYSTCTMAPEENEAVINYLLKHNDDIMIEPLDFPLPNKVSPVLEWNGKQFETRLSHTLRLKPSEHIEAFFVCKMQKLQQ